MDIGIFDSEPDIAALESGFYTTQVDYTAATTETFSVIRVNNDNAVPQEVNAYRMVFTDTVDNSVEYIRGAYYRFLHTGLLHTYYGREIPIFEGLRLTLESSAVHGSTTLYQGNTLASQVQLPRGIFFNLLSDQERSRSNRHWKSWTKRMQVAFESIPRYSTECSVAATTTFNSRWTP